MLMWRRYRSLIPSHSVHEHGANTGVADGHSCRRLALPSDSTGNIVTRIAQIYRGGRLLMAPSTTPSDSPIRLTQP